MPLNQTHILNKSPNITICIIFTKIKCLISSKSYLINRKL